jgi:hypothetical protein
MKKSEMIKALENEYRDFLDNIDLNELLKFLESKGMKPPSSKIEKTMTTDMCIYGLGGMKYIDVVNEWEPEEDENNK